MGARRISRRRLSQLLAAGLPAWPRTGWSQSFDQGIGGTGVVGDPNDEPSDQMIGGTGVIGTIRRFGSIYVNGLRIAYPPTLPVGLADRSVGPKDLRIGQIVRVATVARSGPLTARSITIGHEVVGPVETIEPHRITVLGQTVALDRAAPFPGLTVGQPVAVSGLRRLDGSIMASLIEAAADQPYSVAGPLERKPDGALRIGALRLARVDPSLAGQRVHVVGRMAVGLLRATHVTAERAILARLGATRFSIEGYVGRGSSGVHFGSGLQIGGEVSSPDPDEPSIVTVVLTPHQGLKAEKIVSEAQPSPATRPAPTTERVTRSKDDKGDAGGSKHGSDHGSEGSGKSGGSRGHR